MDTRGPGPHLGLPLAPIDEYLQAVKAHLRIAVRGVHAFIPVNPHIDFVQALFRHSDGIAVAEDGISFAVFTILIGRGHLHQPQLAPKAPGVNDTLHPENIYELRELCRGRHAIVSMQADVKRKVVALLDQVFPEYETAFTNMFGDTSMAILQACPTPKELSEMPLEELCHLIEVSSHKRFRMAKAQELQALARNSFGFAMAGDVFSTMIRLYAKHLDFLKQQVREMDRKIAEIMDTLDTPITTITGIGPTLGAYILSEIGDISRFSSAAKLAAYAGIDPTMRQSGEYNGVRNRMSKRGSPYLRHAIWLAASSAVLHDPALKLYFQKKRDEGKPYMASVGHACRKMVSIIYAVMRDNKAYTPCIPNEISA